MSRNRIFALEIEGRTNTYWDRTLATTQREAERRAIALVRAGVACVVRIVPLRPGRPASVIEPPAPAPLGEVRP